MSSPNPTPRRIDGLDLARGVALVAMAIYHFAWDLEFFGYSEPGTTAVGGWKLFARSIASTFLVLVGVSLYLAHRNGVRWPSYWRRLAMIVASAAAITVATWFATPDFFIFFGILHQIAFASLAGLLFLRLPSLVTMALGAAIVVIGNRYASSAFDAPWLWWTGLSEERPRSSDFVPVFPWFGAVLVGIGAAGLAERAGLLARLAAISPGRWSTPLLLAGRHSLAFYLVHQPVLIACLWLVSQVAPGPLAAPQERLARWCERPCVEQGGEAFCRTYCPCLTEAILADGLYDSVFSSVQDELSSARIRQLAGQCAARAEGAQGGGSQ